MNKVMANHLPIYLMVKTLIILRTILQMFHDALYLYWNRICLIQNIICFFLLTFA